MRPRLIALPLVTALLASVAAVSAVAPQASALSLFPGEKVRTAQGEVRGKVLLDHREFLGIPFAAPPTGERRFAPPAAPAAWPGTRAATSYGPPCPQSALLGGLGDSREDCLTLDVFTPPAAKARNLPVMVWFYGGAYSSGTTRDYVPVPMVTQGDVVVVTVNYRVGPLGFLTVPGTTANAGLLDQQAGLRWVRDNVRAFGGDPGRVTIYGSSAGGNSVCQQLVSPGARGLFHRAISQSGGCSGDQIAGRPVAEAHELGREFAAKLGCTDATTLVRCLRAAPAEKILATPGAGLQDALDTLELPWTPAVDGTVLPLTVDEAFRTGRYTRVPMIVGTNRDEGRLFILLANHILQGKAVTPEYYRTWLGREYGDRAPRVLAEYPLSRYDSPDLTASAVITDDVYSCSTDRTLRDLRRDHPVWAYEYDDEDVPLEGIDPFMPLGAYHGAELYYQFSQVQGLPVIFLNPSQQRLSREMIRAWTTFARTGNPNTSGVPAWPTWTPAKKQVQKLTSAGSRPITTFPAFHRCTFWNALNG